MDGLERIAAALEAIAKEMKDVRINTGIIATALGPTTMLDGKVVSFSEALAGIDFSIGEAVKTDEYRLGSLEDVTKAIYSLADQLNSGQ